MHQHTNNGNTFLLVETLEELKDSDFKVVGNSSGKWLRAITDQGNWWYSEPFPHGNWQILSKGDEATEEQADSVVEELPVDQCVIYKCYDGEYGCHETAIESLNSLLRSLSLNPKTTLILQLQ